MNGKVKFYNETKRFGFIEVEDGKDIFVHVSGLVDTGTLEKDDNVEFDVEEGEKGQKAVNVKLVD